MALYRMHARLAAGCLTLLAGCSMPFGLTGGHAFHGELSLDQFFVTRPLLGWARYDTPIRNLYMCGSGTHPCGGVMGASGRLAAFAILRDPAR